MDRPPGPSLYPPVSGLAPEFAEVQDRVGHRFRDASLLERALTHASVLDSRADAAEADYERLEFLGDRVLSLVIAELLFTTFPRATEGELHRRHAALVRKETCAEVAVAAGLDVAIRLGPGEVLSGGRAKGTILGDVCEAVIGALYLDGGMEPARRFIDSHWRSRLSGATRAARDAKTALQEWAQGRGMPTPTYAISGQSGPQHAPRFTVSVAIVGLAPGQGEGNTRREAEQAAAALVLEREGVLSRERA